MKVPCVLQDFVPFGAAARKRKKKNLRKKKNQSSKDSKCSWPCSIADSKWWGESKAAVSKSQCPVEHRGEFSYVQGNRVGEGDSLTRLILCLRGQISGSRDLILSLGGLDWGFRHERAVLLFY